MSVDVFPQPLLRIAVPELLDEELLDECPELLDEELLDACPELLDEELDELEECPEEVEELEDVLDECPDELEELELLEEELEVLVVPLIATETSEARPVPFPQNPKDVEAPGAIAPL